LKDEIASPRAKNISIDAFVDNKVKLDWKYFFEYCNGCEACVAVCPIKCWFDVIKARQQVVKSWFVSKENQQMVENIEKYRNPFWKLNEGTKTPDKLYCC
jgi:Na+-translocating ferredoxin:NAD+ oxidoreductase RNF subunit RnfB